jgi:hypothetical protein
MKVIHIAIIALFVLSLFISWGRLKPVNNNETIGEHMFNENSSGFSRQDFKLELYGQPGDRAVLINFHPSGKKIERFVRSNEGWEIELYYNWDDNLCKEEK